MGTALFPGAQVAAAVNAVAVFLLLRCLSTLRIYKRETEEKPLYLCAAGGCTMAAQ